MPKVKVNADSWRSNWENGVSTGGDKYRQGVQNVDVSPTSLAADQRDAYLQGVQRSVGKWEKGLRSVTKDDWVKATAGNGADAWTASVSKAGSKVAAHASKAIPIYNNLLSTMPPRGATIDQNLKRVSHFAKGLRAAFNK